MRYLVMENHPGYSIVLDEAGRFLKVANLHYEVGQTVGSVIPMRTRRPRGQLLRIAFAASAAAACLLLAFALYLRMALVPYASIFLSINPDVRMDVREGGEVVALVPLNPDGEQLTAGYHWQHKGMETVSAELSDRAIELGFLADGGDIRVTIEATDSGWAIETGDRLEHALADHLAGRISVTIEVADGFSERPPASSESSVAPVVIPLPEPEPPASSTAPLPPETDEYGDSGYGDSAYGSSGYGDSAYADNGYADNGYADSAYGNSGYADSGYGDSGYN